MVKGWWNIGEVGDKFVNSWKVGRFGQVCERIGEVSEFGRGLVKLVKSWWKVGDFVQSWSIWSKVGKVGDVREGGEVGEMLVNLLKSW